MAIKREILLIVLLILVIAVLVKLVEFFQNNVVGGDASKFVLEDLSTKYPTADIEILAITPKINDNGEQYFQVEAKVTQGNDTPCPQRSNIYYNYPAQNFVPQPPEIVTQNCVVCTVGVCTIAFPEEAIIASHTQPGTSDVQAYLQTYPDALPTVTQQTDSWLVRWDSSTAKSYYNVEVQNNGTIVSVNSYPKS